MPRCLPLFRPAFSAVCLIAALASLGSAQTVAVRGGSVLDADQLLKRQSFWDNRDWDWYDRHIPLFECPDEDLNTTYYYRWELLTKHLTYGSPDTGYLFTEFIDRPFWSGAYGAISCPAGHQLYESRWLRDPRIARDYAAYWMRTPGAQPRNYSTWLADAVWALHQVHPDPAGVRRLWPLLAKNHEAWRQRHFVEDVGLYWQTGHDDGMEFNINSRQTRDILRGAPSYRPSFNAYLWADAMALSRMAQLAGDEAAADAYRRQARQLKDAFQQKLWDPKREFFFPMFKQDEQLEGHVNKALTLTYQTGRYAGSPHGRELIGYVPWQFDMLDHDQGFERAWKFLMDPEYFADAFGPTTVERRDPQFLLQKHCCWWSGQSWPYATTQTLKAMANVLQRSQPAPVTNADYLRLLQTYARSHRKEGRPYLAEALHPSTGSFEGHDTYNHSEHYFHSGFCDLIITGLAGLRPQDNDTVVLYPLAPAEWDYFALDRVPYRGFELTILWDREGTRYGRGRGFTVLADGFVIAQQSDLSPLRAALPGAAGDPGLPGLGTGRWERSVGRWPSTRASFPGMPGMPNALKATEAAADWVNYAVNNDGGYYPRVSASFTAPGTSTAKLVDGNYWYHVHPPNRWTSVGSPERVEEVVIDLGTPRPIEVIALYVLDDRDNADGVRDPRVAAPRKIEVEQWRDEQWMPAAGRWRHGETPAGHRANCFDLLERKAATYDSKFRFRIHHAADAWSGLSEIELWGPGKRPIAPAPPPAGNLAFRKAGAEHPRAKASHTSRFDKVEWANDGLTSFAPAPHNRWTAYESPNEQDWLEIDFGEEVEFRRVELALYDDRGGVQPPERFSLEFWDGEKFSPVRETTREPAQPTGGVWNEVRCDPVKTTRLRIVFTHRGKSRSGVSEVMVWR